MRWTRTERKVSDVIVVLSRGPCSLPKLPNVPIFPNVFPIFQHTPLRLKKNIVIWPGSRRSIVCLSLRLRLIIDLLTTDKARCFATTEFSNCFIIRSLFSFDQLNMSNRSPFSGDRPAIQKRTCNYAWAEYYFVGHVVNSRPMKRKEKYMTNDNCLETISKFSTQQYSARVS